MVFPRGNARSPCEKIFIRAVSTWKRLSQGPMAMGEGHPSSPFGLWRDESAPQGMEIVGSNVRTGQARPPVSRETDRALKRGKSPCRTQCGNKDVTVRRPNCRAAAHRGLRALPSYEIYLSQCQAVRRHRVSTWKRLSQGPMAIGKGRPPSPFGLWREDSASAFWAMARRVGAASNGNSRQQRPHRAGLSTGFT
jgi:hypothetical protein